jgi:hypothetical protein
MGKKKSRLLETKMDILITDFQRFRDSQEQVNKELSRHSSEEDAVQMKILTTLKWHTVIGTGMVTAIGGIAIKVLGM